MIIVEFKIGREKCLTSYDSKSMCLSIAFISSTLYVIRAMYNKVERRFDAAVPFFEEGDLVPARKLFPRFISSSFC